MDTPSLGGDLLRALLLERFDEPLEPRAAECVRVMEEREQGRAPSVELYRGMEIDGVAGLVSMEDWKAAVRRVADGRLEGEAPTPVERAAAEHILWKLENGERREE